MNYKTTRQRITGLQNPQIEALIINAATAANIGEADPKTYVLAASYTHIENNDLYLTLIFRHI